MNNKLLVALAAASALSLSVPTFANYGASGGAGVYVGGQLGWGQTDYGVNFDNFEFIEDVFSGHTSDESGLAGRIYLGYQFNSYVGLEIGAALFSDSDFYVTNNTTFEGRVDVNTSQFDLLLKVGSPFGCSGFRGDIKLGIADVVTDIDNGGFDRWSDNADNAINFALGGSLSYNINRCVAVDVSWLHTFGNNGNRDNFDLDRDFSPDTDLVTLGVSYTFM